MALIGTKTWTRLFKADACRKKGRTRVISIWDDLVFVYGMMLGIYDQR